MKKLIWLASLVLVLGGLHHWTSGADPAAPADESIAVVTHVDVMPNFTAAGRSLLKEFAVAARNDPGVVRVEVLEELGRPNHSTLVEIWKNRRAYDDHLAADHTRTFRTKLQPMLGSPFDERLHRLSESLRRPSLRAGTGRERFCDSMVA